MTPDQMAELHRACFTVPRPWSADEFTTILADRHILCEATDCGFALARVVADEAELLTIAVDPAKRRTGTARQLLVRLFEAMKSRGARTCFLEVAASNAPALGLYAELGYAESGRRRGYYHRSGGQTDDAVILSKLL